MVQGKCDTRVVLFHLIGKPQTGPDGSDTAEIRIWTRKLSESRDKFHLECKLHFLSAQLILRQIYLRTVSASIEAKY